VSYSGLSQRVARQVAGRALARSRCLAGIFGRRCWWVPLPPAVAMLHSPHAPGCPRRGRKNARRSLEIRMFLWLNCFVASVECVPGLDLNSCAGPGVCSADAQAAVGRAVNNDDFAGVLLCPRHVRPQRWLPWGRFPPLGRGTGVNIPSPAVMLGHSLHPSPAERAA